jgi:hypothetical protein
MKAMIKKYRFYLKHNNQIRRVKRWVTMVYDGGVNELGMWVKITFEGDDICHNSFDRHFNLSEPSVSELLEYRKNILVGNKLNESKS